jgi:hypothetical protein
MYPAWIDDFQAFADYLDTVLGPRPHKYSLDRINNEGHYEPGNLRWATYSEQAFNRRPPGLMGMKPLSRKGIGP